MSRGRTRARRRRARMEKVRTEFQEARSNPEAFEQLLRRLADSDLSVWNIARSASVEKPLDDAEVVMIAHIVAPHLAGRTRGSVYNRPQLASKARYQSCRKSPVSALTAETGEVEIITGK